MANDGGIGRLQQRLKAIPKDVQEEVQKAVLRNANTMAGTMRQLVPEDQGKLKESITVTGPGDQTPPYSQPGGSTVVPENAVAITVGNSDVRYSHLVEYGTSQAPAQPYFWPAVRLHQKRATRSIKSAVSRAVKKNWGKG